MRPKKEILDTMYEGLGPTTQVSHYQSKALEAILEVMLDIRDLQLEMNHLLFSKTKSSQ
jgi:hypothetical protein